jgi:hypothetical protein
MRLALGPRGQRWLTAHGPSRQRRKRGCGRRALWPTRPPSPPSEPPSELPSEPPSELPHARTASVRAGRQVNLALAW